LHVSISPKAAKRFFAIVVFVALCLNLVSFVQQCHDCLPGAATFIKVLSVVDPDGDGYLSVLDVNEEASIPTWFSSSALLLCSVLLVSIACDSEVRDARYATRWKVLPVIFLLLSLDEIAAFHERLTPLSSSALNTIGLDSEGFLYYPWVVLGAGFVLVFLLAYLRFFLDLPTRTRRLFAVAGSLYVIGALGMEMLGAKVADFYGSPTLTYAAIVTTEEFFEMLGSAIFLYALMTHTTLLREAVQEGHRGG
jgi:hypothetical protein